MGPICSTCPFRGSFALLFCTNFISNRSNRLTTFFNVLSCWPPKTPRNAPGVLRGELYLAYSIPRRIRRRVPNWLPIGQAVWQLPKTFEYVTPYPPPPKCPWGIVGRIVFSLCLFPDESADGYQQLVPIGAAVWQLTESFELVTP